MSEMVERVARALMTVYAAKPGNFMDGREFPVLAMDPDWDDLPADRSEGTDEDEITQEAVLRLARAAIAAMRTPTPEMSVIGQKTLMAGSGASCVFMDMIDAALQEKTP